MNLVGVSYNKTEDDFDTLDEYNDYLETLENLSNEILIVCQEDK